MNLIAQGAEAILYLKDKNIIKERIKKDYRLEEIDNKIRKQRTKREIKLLDKAHKLIPTPKVLNSNKMLIEMEYINGKKLSEHLDKLKNRNQIAKLIGEQVAILHDNNIIHGDLTTSNMIFKDDKLYFIDYGLGFEDIKPEHKAVDLHLLRQALESKHYKHFEELYKEVLEGYQKSKTFKQTMKRLEHVESRGRYKKRK